MITKARALSCLDNLPQSNSTTAVEAALAILGQYFVKNSSFANLRDGASHQVILDEVSGCLRSKGGPGFNDLADRFSTSPQSFATSQLQPVLNFS